MKNDIEPLMTLPEAAELLFRDASKVNALRTEIRHGNLAPRRIAGTFYVTKTDLREMNKKCQENQKAQGSGLEKQAKSGSSEMVTPTNAQDAAKARLQKLRRNLPNISKPNGNQTQAAPAQIIPIARTSS